MKLKTSLLGVAIGFSLISTAWSADSIVVEPEPVDYLRICDTYGSGFFYIPGTETCLRFSGYVRSSYEKLHLRVDNGSVFNGALGNFGFPANDEYNFAAWGNRARLNVDTRTETDWGTLRALYRLEGGQSNVDTDIRADVALISLAGFRAGMNGANFWSSNHSYGWVNSEGIGSNAGGIAADDGLYGFDYSTVFDYTWAREGWSVTVGVEDPRISFGRENFGNSTNSGGPDSRANFYAGVSYTAHWGGVAFTAVHDSLAPEISVVTPNAFAGTVVSDTGGWAYKISAFLDLSDHIPGGSVWGMYMEDGDYNTDYVHANGLLENPDNVWGVAYQMELTKEIEFWANYFEADGGTGHIFGGPGSTFGTNTIFATNVSEGGVRQFGIGLNWYPKAAPGFHIKASYVHGDVDNTAHALVCNGSFPLAGPQGCSFEFDAFSVSLRRDF